MSCGKLQIQQLTRFWFSQLFDHFASINSFTSSPADPIDSHSFRKLRELCIASMAIENRNFYLYSLKEFFDD